MKGLGRLLRRQVILPLWLFAVMVIIIIINAIEWGIRG